MAKHFIEQRDLLNKKFQELCELVEDLFDKSTQALETNNLELAREITRNEEHVDKLEILIEEECLKYLALYQPVAIDLRYVVSILKINNDLERIGDLTENMASRCIRMSEFPVSNLNSYLLDMAAKVKVVLHLAITSMLERDKLRAVEACRLDREINDMHAGIYEIAQEKMKEDSDNIPYYINCISYARFLERIADHATNVAEDVYYMMEGEIVRHTNFAKKN